MGQYFKPVIGNDNEKAVLEMRVNGSFVFQKLTEHSWFANEYVNAVSEMMYKNQQRLAWVGDYADDDGNLASKTSTAQVDLLKDDVWGEDVPELRGITSTSFNLKDKYLVNHDTKEYLDCTKYFNRSKAAGWCLHPVPLLTAVGNGRGGGDFHNTVHKKQEENVGLWAWNLLSIEDTIPQDYKEVKYTFKEEY